MKLHSELRALRDDDAPQRHAQAALQAALAVWRERQAGEVHADLDRLAAGAGLGECAALAPLFTPGEAAPAFVASFARAMTEVLRKAPLGHVPLRHFTDGVTSTLLLARSANVTLALIAVDGVGFARRASASTVDFGPTETWEHVLAGTAAAEWIEACDTARDRAVLKRGTLALAPGQVIHRQGSREALQLRGVNGCLVSLRLQRRHANGEPTREYALADGRLVHQAAGDPADSRTELAIALLGRMGRTDAAPAMAAIALEPGSAALRWQALRECLALDTRTGFEALARIARDAADPLCAPAGALRAQLIEAYPQLKELAPCPD